MLDCCLKRIQDPSIFRSIRSLHKSNHFELALYREITENPTPSGSGHFPTSTQTWENFYTTKPNTSIRETQIKTLILPQWFGSPTPLLPWRNTETPTTKILGEIKKKTKWFRTLSYSTSPNTSWDLYPNDSYSAVVSHIGAPPHNTNDKLSLSQYLGIMIHT